MLEDEEKQEFQEVVVWKINRLARKSVDLLSLVDELHQRQIQVRSMTETLDFSTPSGRLTLHMLAVMSEFEYNTAFENEQLNLS
ncbi:DNA-invertase hin [compost metagenome]